MLASVEFSRSERLSSFLSYVCNMALAQSGLRLTEQHIGVHVFGRPDNYAPAEDTIVRTTAAMLRKRLTKYYEGEGVADPIRIAIPRGSYSPLFVSNEAPSEARTVAVDQEAASTEAILSPNSRSTTGWRDLFSMRPWRNAFGACLAIVSVLVVGAVAMPGWSSDPVDVFWKSLLHTNRETLFVPADSELVMHQQAIGHRIVLGDYIAKRFDTTVPGDGAAASTQFRWRRYTGVISVTLAVELGKLTAGAPQALRVRYARDMQLNDLKHANAILVGTADANPWVSLFRERLNYHIDWDPSSRKSLVRNDAPLRGEQALYEFGGAEREKHGFAILAYTPNLSADGHILMVGGTSSVGTEAAADFLFNRERMREVLVKAIRPDGSFRPFEVLLQCELQASGSTNVRVLGVRIKSV
ncbi:hypothetical protein [Duganella levis]|uniref:DUF4880 domain-containing protein n=1 Tax=Duganella levis TaxID=2692169 RepID=A0ABW9VT86_9BURK|nr:hypothetical protein [Duganella levis]MYN24835.1 hypothetical protein [Duganella levis]